jgi:hypothetical protein
MIHSTIHKKVRAYCTDNMSDRHGSEYSWVQCYRHFHKFVLRPHEEDPDHAALHLGFYLASWGMFRNSFLGSHTYTVHLGAIDQLVAPRFSALWKPELGIDDNDSTLVPLILEAINAVREAYRPFASKAGASDILVTKILLGTICCLPACDTYFTAGFRSCGFRYSSPNAIFVGEVFRFCRNHLSELREAQGWIESQYGLRYPFMKIMDMYFWQTGFDSDRP